MFAEVNTEDESHVPLYKGRDAEPETTTGTLPLFEVGKFPWQYNSTQPFHAQGFC